MDDHGLMVKYGLSPDQLQRELSLLIDMDLLSEEQITVRAQLSERLARAFLEVHKESKEIP